MKLISKLNIDQDPKRVLFIGGPTASGKTSLSIKIAQELVQNGQATAIISADSRQIYIGMDICSAKPTKRALTSKILSQNLYLVPVNYKDIDHYLFDVVYPDQKYTLFDFKHQAEKVIQQLHSNNIKVIVAGGTGLYIDALINNYQLNTTLDTKSTQIRQELESKYEQLKKSNGEAVAKSIFWQDLKLLDPQEANKIDPNNIYGIIRAIEVIQATSKPKSKLATKSKPDFTYQMLILNPPRTELYDYINNRCQEMLDEGLLEETQQLIQDYSSDLPSMTSIGYKQFRKYLNQEISLQEALQDFQKATRNYAKRQLTWFRRYKENPNTKFIDSYQLLKKDPS